MEEKCWHHRRMQGLYSLSGKTSYRKISWSLEAARFGFKLLQSLWNLAGTSAALLPRCLSNFRAIRPLQHPISRLRDFTRFGGKTSYRLVNRPWVAHGGGGAHLFGRFGLHTQLHVIVGNLNAVRCHDGILCFRLPEYHFQYDNARPHVARMCREFLDD